MASVVRIAVFQKNEYPLKKVFSTGEGVAMIFSPSDILVSEVTKPLFVNGVEMNSVITVLGTGLNQPPTLYYTDELINDINTNINA